MASYNVGKAAEKTPLAQDLSCAAKIIKLVVAVKVKVIGLATIDFKLTRTR